VKGGNSSPTRREVFMQASVASVARGLRALTRFSLAFHVLFVGAGVSVPATAADDRAGRHVDRGVRTDGADRDGRQQRQRVRESQGERGHVRRRNDLIDRSTHVEKREGWRRID
jgi:hypothetical protein